MRFAHLIALPLVLALGCGDDPATPDEAPFVNEGSPPTPAERTALRHLCDRRTLDECAEDSRCRVHEAPRAHLDRMCLEPTAVACMSVTDCGDQAIVLIESPNGETHVSFTACAPVDWVYLTDGAAEPYARAWEWPVCER